MQDAVYVLRGAHGGEVFRKYLPRYSRSGVTFLGSRYFAYSADGRVQVLRLPD